MTEISNLKELEAIKASEAKYKAVFDTVNDIIMIQDPETGAILDVNRSLTEMSGYTVDEARRMTIGDFGSGIPPYIQEEAIRRMKEAIRQGGSLFEWRAKDKFGRLFWVEVNLNSTVIDGKLRVVAVVRNITERKQTEERLQKALAEADESRLTLEAIMEYSPMGIIMANAPDVRIRSVSLSALEMAGHPHEGIEGNQEEKHIEQWEFYHKDGVTAASNDELPLVRAIQKGEIILEEEWVLGRPDGTRIPVLCTSAPVRDRSGKITSGVVGWQDITERKQAEDKIRRLNAELEQKVHERTVSLSRTVAKLEEQREVLQTVIDNIPVMLAFYDSQGKISLVSRELERVLGWSEEELRNMDVMAAVYPDPEYRRQVWEYMMKARPGWKDLEMTTRSGSRVYGSWTNAKLSDGSQIGIGIDVSERRKMEQELLRMAAAVDQAGEGIALFNPDSVFEYLNPAYERLFGYERHELIGKTTAVLGKDVYEAYQEVWRKIRTDGKAWTGRKSRRKKNGEKIEVDMIVAPVYDKAGRIIHYLSIYRDATQEVRVQQQLDKAQKMDAIGALAGGIAHDLKNILTPILINTEIALEDVGNHHPAYPVLEEVLDAAKLGRDLVQQILTFSRSTPQKKAPVNIAIVIKETMGFLRSTLPSTIEIHSKLKDECVIAYADPTQIKQVLINLGTNAGQAMRDQGGTLDVSESKTVLDEDTAARISPDLAAGPYIQVEVQDTGQGMDEQTMEHIFEPFFTTKKGEGTGMGLAVVHGIVKEHQGAVTVRSIPGEGSTFTVLLPILQGDSDDELCDSLGA